MPQVSQKGWNKKTFVQETTGTEQGQPVVDNLDVNAVPVKLRINRPKKAQLTIL